MFLILLAAFGIAGSPQARADFLAPADLPKTSFDCCDWNFLAPNEETPIDALSYFLRAIPGVYVSVGTERGFIGAALSPKVTHLLLIDLDKKAVVFNQMNIALLSIATSPFDYRFLRLHASAEEWVSRVGKPGRVEKLDAAILVQKNYWEWWKNSVRENSDFEVFNSAPASAGRDFAFRGANYMYYEPLFWRLKEMAMAGKIQAIQGDLKNLDSLRMIGRAIQRAGLALSVLDLSNVWQFKYIGLFRTFDVFDQFRDAAKEGSFALLTGYDESIDAPPTPNLAYDPRFKRFPAPFSVWKKGHSILKWPYKAYRIDSRLPLVNPE